MTHKQRMLAAIAGLPTDRIPWAPRMDLWYRANRRAGSLPRRYRDATLVQLLEDTGMGLHAVVPDFRDLRSPSDDIDRGLGLYRLKVMPYQTVLENVERRVRYSGDRTFVEYATPVGTVSTTVLYDDAMRTAGVTITHIEEHAIKAVQDYDPVGCIFENARVEPQYDGYRRWADDVGEHGIAVAMINLAAGPMQAIQCDLMPLDLFFLTLHDHPDELARLSERIGRYFERVFEVAIECPADVFFFGSNYDATVTYPPFFAEHIEPWLKKAADLLHARGKYLLTHTDGENAGLLEHYLRSDVDIADSVCPAPMTQLSLGQVRDAFDGRITVMGGVPSVTLLESTMSEAQFDAFLDEFFEQLGSGNHLILGISDTTPPAAPFERILKVGRRVEQFGAVPRETTRRQFGKGT